MARKLKAEPGYGAQARKRIKVNSRVICDIMTNYGINKNFLDRVQQALQDYPCKRYFLDGFNDEEQKIAPSRAESMNRLKRLRRHAEALTEGLESLDRNALQQLGGDLDLITKTQAYVTALSVLLANCTAGDTPEASGKKGRAPHTAKHALVFRLAAIYFEATEKKASITWNAYSECYTGEFLDFAFDLTKLVKPETDKKALGKFIKDTLASRTKSQK